MVCRCGFNRFKKPSFVQETDPGETNNNRREEKHILDCRKKGVRAKQNITLIFNRKATKIKRKHSF